MFRTLDATKKYTFAEGPVRVEAFNKRNPDGSISSGQLCIGSNGVRLLRIYAVNFEPIPEKRYEYTEDDAKRWLESNSREDIP